MTIRFGDDYYPGRTMKTELNMLNGIMNKARIDAEIIEELPAAKVFEYREALKVASRQCVVVKREHYSWKENKEFVELEAEIHSLSKLYKKHLVNVVADSGEMVWTGIVSEKNYSDALKNILVNAENRKENLKDTLVRYRNSKSPDDIPLTEILQQVVLITSRKGNDDAINRAVFKLHHDYQISPVRLSQILQYHDILECQNICIMRRSEAEFEKHEKPKWLLNVENSI